MDTAEDNKSALLETIHGFRKKVLGSNCSFADSQKAYDEWAETYEETLNAINARTHIITAETVADLYPSDVRDKVKILDVGAGTGMVASALIELGFKHIDALEPNQFMLNKAKLQNRYENYFTESVKPEEFSSVKNQSYDVVTSCACFTEAGHIPPEAIKDIVRMAKTGGHVVIITRLLTDETLKVIEDVMNSLEADKKWLKVTRKVWPGYNEVTGDFGITWVYKAL